MTAKIDQGFGLVSKLQIKETGSVRGSTENSQEHTSFALTVFLSPSAIALLTMFE